MATGHALAIPRPSLEVKSIAPHSPEKPSPIPPSSRRFPLSRASPEAPRHGHYRSHAPCPPRAVGLSLGAPPLSATSSSPTESSRDPCIAYINSFKLRPPLIVASIRCRSTRSDFTKLLLVTDVSTTWFPLCSRHRARHLALILASSGSAVHHGRRAHRCRVP